MKSRILVIEDSAVIQRLIEVCLRATDIEIVVCGNGKDGLRLAGSESFELVVLDIGLPGLDGWEILGRIRSKESTRELPVVVLTAHAEEEAQRRAQVAGADEFITKPFQPHEFRTKVLDLLGAHSTPRA